MKSWRIVNTRCSPESESQTGRRKKVRKAGKERERVLFRVHAYINVWAHFFYATRLWSDENRIADISVVGMLSIRIRSFLILSRTRSFSRTPGTPIVLENEILPVGAWPALLCNCLLNDFVVETFSLYSFATFFSTSFYFFPLRYPLPKSTS